MKMKNLEKWSAFSFWQFCPWWDVFIHNNNPSYLKLKKSQMNTLWSLAMLRAAAICWIFHNVTECIWRNGLLQYIQVLIQSNAKHIYLSIYGAKEKSDTFLVNILKLSPTASLNVNFFLKWIIPPVTKPPSCDQFHSRGSYKSDVKPSAVKNKSVHPWCHERHIISPISIIYQTFA